MTRQVRRAEARLNEKLRRMERNGFTYSVIYRPAHVARSKYMPHIGKKERSRYAA